jgi:mxaA protein
MQASVAIAERDRSLRGKRHKLVFYFAASVMLTPSAWAQIRSIDARPPQRDFGYYAGDLLISTVVVDVGPDTVLDANSLPPTGPVSSAIDLRNVSFTEARMPGGHRITVRAEWQNFYTPDEVSRLDIPGYQLVFHHGPSRLTADISGFSISVSPFRHDLQPVLDTSVLRPNHPVTPIDITPSKQMLVGSGALAILAAITLVCSSGVWPWTRRGHAPFARAAREIARYSGESREALLLLHRAFDDTAGERVLAEDLEAFLITQVRFGPLDDDIKQFFAESRKVFFDIGHAPPTLPSLVRLSRALARAERR